MDVLTDEGRPAQIDRVWFRARYGQNFPDLLPEETNEILDNCIDSVYTIFHGVADLWDIQPREVYVNKTQMCYGLLVAWYITDVFPAYAIGVASTGGIPLQSKSIGGVTLKFRELESSAGTRNNADLLASLKSNSFGAKAYLMIKTSGKLNLFLAR